MAAVAAGHTVLTPNTELAAALFDAAERTYQESGREIWPTPRVRDFGGWLREAYVGRQLRDAATPRALSDIEERELCREVIEASEAGRDMLDPGGAARRRPTRRLRERDSVGRRGAPRYRESRVFSAGTRSPPAAGCWIASAAMDYARPRRPRSPLRGSRARRGGPWRANGCSAMDGCCFRPVTIRRQGGA
jgi:hypothetical protein